MHSTRRSEKQVSVSDSMYPSTQCEKRQYWFSQSLRRILCQAPHFKNALKRLNLYSFLSPSFSVMWYRWHPQRFECIWSYNDCGSCFCLFHPAGFNCAQWLRILQKESCGFETKKDSISRLSLEEDQSSWSKRIGKSKEIFDFLLCWRHNLHLEIDRWIFSS